MKKILKAIIALISIICIAFTAFFVYSYSTGNVAAITAFEKGLATIANHPNSTAANDEDPIDDGVSIGLDIPGIGGSKSTVSMLTEEYGLTTSQAGQVISMIEGLGVDVGNAAAMSTFVARNAGNAAEIRSIAADVQSGELTESQAKAKLASILDV